MESEFSIVDIESMAPDELLEILYKSMVDMKPVNLVKIEKNEMTKDIFEPSFDLIKTGIKLNDSEKEFEIQVPVYNERYRSHFKEHSLMSRKISDMMPVTGYFVQSDVDIVIKPFGLLELNFSGFKAVRNDNDFRYLKYKLVYKQTDYYCYKYDEKRYVKVPEKELEKLKFQLQKNGEVDLDSAHELVKMYMEREAILNEALKKLKGLYEDYQIELESFLYDDYSANGKTTISTVNNYFNRYERFLNESMLMGLKLKFVYSQVSRREFDELLKESERLIGILNNGVGMLKKISDLVKGDFAHYDLLRGPTEGTEEFEIKNKLLDTILTKDLIDFKTTRPYKFSYTNPMEGYIDFDLETSEVFPNIIQLESRVLINEEDQQEDVQNERGHIRKIIEFKKERTKKS